MCGRRAIAHIYVPTGLAQLNASGKGKDASVQEEAKQEAARLTRRKLADGSAQEVRAGRDAHALFGRTETVQGM